MKNLRKSVATLVVAALFLGGCASEVAEPAGAVSLDLSAEDESRIATMNAACYCQALLLRTDGFNGVNLSDDPELADYQSGGRNECSTALSPRASFSTQQLAPGARNPCGSTLGAPAPGQTSASERFRYREGFCRAEFNYCMGQELRLKAESLANPPSGPEAGDLIRGGARVRFQAAAVEFAASLGYWNAVCAESGVHSGVVNPAPYGHLTYCTQLDGPLSQAPELMAAHMADSIAKLGETLEEEVQSAMVRSDATTPSTEGGVDAYLDSIWSPTGLRMGVAAAIHGDVDEAVSAEPYDAEIDPLGSEGTYGSFVQRDSGAKTALDLIMAFEVPTPVIALDRWSPVWDDEDFVAAVYNFMDHRIAAEMFIGPYSMWQLSDADYENVDPRTLPGHVLRDRQPLTMQELLAYQDTSLGSDSVLADRGVTVADVAAAFGLLRDVLFTMVSDAQIRPMVITPGEHTLHAVRVSNVRQRHPLALAGSLAADPLFEERMCTNSIDTDCARVAAYLPILPADTGEQSSGYGANNWYNTNFSDLSRRGASGSMNILRVLLLKLVHDANRGADAELGEVVAGILPADSLDASLALVESHAGDFWTEYTREPRLSTNCSVDGPQFAACLDPVASPAGCPCLGVDVNCSEASGNTNRWTIAIREDSELADATFVRVGDERGALCLAEGGTPASCGVAATALPPDPFPFLPRNNMFRPQYRMLEFELQDGCGLPAGLQERNGGDNSRSRIFVLARRGDRYTLVDVVQPLDRASVHSFGGRFGELFSRVVARQPWNPGLPAVDARAFPLDYVPPLENELIDNQNNVEDSYATYLRVASQAATVAQMRLAQARLDEIEQIREEAADEALLEQAVVAEQSVVSRNCGDSVGPNGCDEAALEVSDPVTFGALGLVPAAEAEIPTGWAPEGQPRPTCEAWFATNIAQDYAALASDSDARDLSEFMEGYLGDVLKCARYMVIEGARDAELRDVPLAVVRAIQEGRPGTFPELGGELRTTNIEMHSRLMAFKDVLQRFDAMHTAAMAELRATASRVDDMVPSQRAVRRCKVGKALSVIVTVVAAVVASVASFGTAAAGAVVAVLVVVSAVVGIAAAGIEVAASGKCSGPQEEARTEAELALAGVMRAVTSFSELTDETRRTASQLAISSERIRTIQLEASLAMARRDIDEVLISTNALADLPEWQALSALNRRDADEALLRAQRHAFVARRAIEFRLGEDMSSLTQDETFVDAPAFWVDGLGTIASRTSFEQNADGEGQYVHIAGEAMVDYVQGLEDFVRGYSFSRPFQDATDTQVLNLEFIGKDDDDTSDPTLLAPRPFWQRVSYKCFGHDQELPGGTLVSDPLQEAPCEELGGVQYASYSFHIGEKLDGYVESRLAAGNYNYRHESLALNISGGGVVQCELATRPSECYSDGNIQYTLRQEGTVFVESYSGDVREYGMEPGVIQSARALALERVLTTPLSTTDASLIGSFSRGELRGRPLRGVYTLRIPGRPEIDFTRMDGIQMLLSYRYWTRQN